MNKSLFLLPYLISLAISLGVLGYTWRFRNVRGAKAYAWYVAGQSFWIFGYILELVNPGLDGKIFWDRFQWFAGIFILIAFPVFAIQYTQAKIWRPHLMFGLSLVLPTSFLIALVTENQHHLLYPNPHLDHTHIFSDLKYDFTWVVYVYAIYSYLITFTGLGILLRRLKRPHNLYRQQILTVAFGFFIPIGTTLLTVMGIDFKPFRDVSPFTFAIGNLIIAWGLFRYRLFDVLPIARDIILENMLDLVIVLDAQDRIIDANPSALFALNRRSNQVIGQRAEMVFRDWPELIEKFNKVENSSSEIAIKAFGSTSFYEVKSTILEEKRQGYLGRVFVARDITERVNLQTSLKKLNEELEERVKKRTEELRKSEERYRAVVENQTELITRWKPDRTRTFVNDAYCRYFDLTTEEAMENDFMSLIVEEDHPAKLEKISRLEAGENDSKLDIQRVQRPDGSIGWQEWVDTAIRDENGKVIEFQSVGRDITERKQAELRLAEAYDTTLEGWAKALELRDKETEDHSRRVTKLTVTLAKAMGIDGDELTHIRRGAILHDIGKMGIPDEILRKPEKLTDDEMDIIRQHPVHSYKLLSSIPFLHKALDIPYCHHEHWDGSGYPRGLKEEEIPLAARIFSVVDVWDAVLSDRPYNHAWTKEKAIQYLYEEAGKNFDPQVVKVFLGLVEQGKI